MSNGIKTSFWGPHAWAYLFSSIAGSYPTSLDESNVNHMKIVKSFKSMFSSLQYTLPCKYCRDSYCKFFKEIPISEYVNSRRMMMKWLYLIHDKVNRKLITQETELFEIKKKELMNRSLTPTKLKSEVAKLRSIIFKTKPSPPFEKVVLMYDKQRA